MGQITNQLWEALLGALVGAILTSIVYFYKNLHDYIKTFNVRRFWRPFMKKPLTIVYTEYPATGSDRLAMVAKIAGGGFLMSKGMALSIGTIFDFLSEKITERKSISIRGAQSNSNITENQIILGGPASNPFASSVFSLLNENFEMPYKMLWSDDGTPIEIMDLDGNKFTPSLENGLGFDYALIIKAQYQSFPKKWVILLNGCYMWGTEVAAKALSEPRILNEVVKHTNNAPNVAFVIRTRIVNNNVTGPELFFDRQRYIKTLMAKNGN